MDGNRSYKIVVLGLPLVLIAYSLTALSHSLLNESAPGEASSEVFPFFDWSLFSSPRRQAVRYTVQVMAVGESAACGDSLLGRTLIDVPAVEFLRDIRFQKTARALERAYEEKDSGSIETLRAMLGNFMRPYGVQEFNLVRLVYDPLAYYKDSEAPEEVVVAPFGLEPGR